MTSSARKRIAGEIVTPSALAVARLKAPDYCIDEVAYQTLSFILGLTRQVVTHTRELQAGRWGLAVPVQEMRVLREQTVGVLGFGRIGREVVRRLLAFKCRVLVHDPMVATADIVASRSHAAWAETRGQ